MPIDEVVTPPAEFEDAVAQLYEDIERRDIPKWLLIPGRAAGEHATGGAWTGVVMAECYDARDNGRETATIDARIAWDTEDRGRGKSTVTDVPPALRETVTEATSETDGASMCVARVELSPEEMNLQSLTIGLRVAENPNESEA